jgi:hypothetical protein
MEFQLEKDIQNAVAYYWRTRADQVNRQKESGRSDQGSRGAATGGAHMDGFIKLFSDQLENVGIDKQYIFTNKSIELPGFFRPTKEWDLLAVKNGELIAVIEAKSQVGPSFGNNFNNRTEEAMGSAMDLWTAFRERAFLNSPAPFLGYFFMLEDCDKSNSPVKVRESHFNVFPEFIDASYRKRYELFSRKLVLERHYTSSAFITSSEQDGIKGKYNTPSEDLSLDRFVRLLTSHASQFK